MWLLGLSVINLGIILWNFHRLPTNFYGEHPLVFIILKILIVPILCLHVFLELGQIPNLVGCFALFSWLGDIVLLSKRYIAYTLGGILFLFAHVSMIRFYDPPLEKTDWIVFLIGLPSAVALIVYLFPLIILKRTEYAGVVAYLIVLSASLFAAAQRKFVIDPLSPQYVMSTFGHFVFTVSDFFLIKSLAVREENTSNFKILLTYGVAQICIFSALAF
jgi:uncharacterized membrane protein YhhN